MELTYSRLKQELASLEESTAAIKRELKSSGEACANPLMDMLDRAQDEIELKSRIRVHNHSASRMTELRQALRRMKSGDFGVCANCGGEIDLRRLEAQPASELCISCQMDHEIGIPVTRNGMAA